jgi:hypothetical protein
MNYQLSLRPELNSGSIRNPLFYLFIFICLFSCEDKTVDYGLDTYYVEFVTAQNKNEFLSDNGKMIIVSSDGNNRNYAFGDRVLVNYTLLSSNASAENLTARIIGSGKFPLGKLTLVNDSIIKASDKEPVLLESVWLGSHYLNMQFYLNYKSTAHKIGLLTDSTCLESDTLRMYFVHDTNNDPPGYPSHSYLSFDLKDILGIPEKNRPISVQINSSNYGNKIYEFVY